MPPLNQLFWKDGPLNITMVTPFGDIGLVPQVFDKFKTALDVGSFNVIVFSDAEAPLFEGGGPLSRRLPWHVETVSKVHRMVATVSGTHLQTWWFTSSQETRDAKSDPVFKVVRLLSPGLEPRKLFVNIPPSPPDLWAVCVPFAKVASVLAVCGVKEEQVVVLPGPWGSNNRWVLIRNVASTCVAQVEEAFYEEPGFAICPYRTFKGLFGENDIVLQVFWRKLFRSPENIGILWKSVHFQLKKLASDWGKFPELQWVGANKLRLGLGNQDDLTLFMQRVLPNLKQRGLVFKNEKTGEFLDEDDSSSVAGQSSASGASSHGTRFPVDETVVITDLPDFFLPLDVVSVVREAMKVRQVVGAEVNNLLVRKLDWSMGSPMAPSWQVGGKGTTALEGAVLAFNSDGQQGMAMVLPWKEYASARAAWRARRQSGPPQQRQGAQSHSILPVPGAQVHASQSGPLFSAPVIDRMDTMDGVRGKRVRDGTFE
jgi:hypothetical protein